MGIVHTTCPANSFNTCTAPFPSASAELRHFTNCIIIIIIIFIMTIIIIILTIIIITIIMSIRPIQVKVTLYLGRLYWFSIRHTDQSRKLLIA